MGKEGFAPDLIQVRGGIHDMGRANRGKAIRTLLDTGPDRLDAVFFQQLGDLPFPELAAGDLGLDAGTEEFPAEQLDHDIFVFQEAVSEGIEVLTGDVEDRWEAGAITEVHALRLWNMLPFALQAIEESGPDLPCLLGKCHRK